MSTHHSHFKKSIGYVRSNTRDCDGEKDLLEQVSRILSAGVDTIICDSGSASDNERQGLKILLKLAKKGQIREVVVTRWDRLTRSSKIYSELSNAFSTTNIRIRLLDQGEINFPIKEDASWSLLNSIFQKQNCQSNNCN